MTPMSEEPRPVPSKSHWCEGRTQQGRECHQVVSNDSDHCEAGHKNKIQMSGQTGPHDFVRSGESIAVISMETDGFINDTPTGEAVPTQSDIPVRTWRMHAGRDEYHEGGFIYFGDPRTIKMYDVEPVEVELTENPEGSYYGWLETGEDIPVMIQPHIHMYNIQFAYGPEAEIRQGRGITLRFNVVEVIHGESQRDG